MLSEQQQRIMGYFIEEAKDHLNTIEQGLLNLQSTIADSEMVNEMFRAAHSVKGGAAMLGLNGIQQTSHRLEDYFKVLKECPIQVDQKLETLFLRVFDTLQELLEHLQGPFGLTDDKAEEVMADVMPVFTALNEHLGHLMSQCGAVLPEDVDLGLEQPAAAPVSSPPARVQAEESALRLVFQSDVPAQLREMLSLFKQVDQFASREQLQAICRTLIRAGEQFELPQWCELLEIARQAIAHPDNSYRTLAPIVIKDIKQAQELVLSGRSAEICCSETLQVLVPMPVSADVLDDLADLLASADLDGSNSELDLSDFDLDADEAPLTAAESNSSDDLLDQDDSWFSELTYSESTYSESTYVDESTFVNESTFIQQDSTFSESELGFEEPTQYGSSSGDASLNPSQPPISSRFAEQTGPEVGMAELNSLADLFEGEVPDLGMTWQEEVIIVDATGDYPDTLDPDDSSDFSDLLFDADVLDDDLSLQTEQDEDDLSGLLSSSELFGDSSEMELPIAAQVNELASHGFDESSAGLADEFTSAESEIDLTTDSDLSLASLEDEFGFGLEAISDTALDQAQQPTPQSSVSGKDDLENLTELFADLDNDVTADDAAAESPDKLPDSFSLNQLDQAFTEEELFVQPAQASEPFARLPDPFADEAAADEAEVSLEVLSSAQAESALETGSFELIGFEDSPETDAEEALDVWAEEGDRPTSQASSPSGSVQDWEVLQNSSDDDFLIDAFLHDDAPITETTLPPDEVLMELSESLWSEDAQPEDEPIAPPSDAIAMSPTLTEMSAASALEPADGAQQSSDLSDPWDEEFEEFTQPQRRPQPTQNSVLDDDFFEAFPDASAERSAQAEVDTDLFADPFAEIALDQPQAETPNLDAALDEEFSLAADSAVAADSAPLQESLGEENLDEESLDEAEALFSLESEGDRPSEEAALLFSDSAAEVSAPLDDALADDLFVDGFVLDQSDADFLTESFSQDVTTAGFDPFDPMVEQTLDQPLEQIVEPPSEEPSEEPISLLGDFSELDPAASLDFPPIDASGLEQTEAAADFDSLFEDGTAEFPTAPEFDLTDDLRLEETEADLESLFGEDTVEAIAPPTAPDTAVNEPGQSEEESAFDSLFDGEMLEASSAESDLFDLEQPQDDTEDTDLSNLLSFDQADTGNAFDLFETDEATLNLNLTVEPVEERTEEPTEGFSENLFDLEEAPLDFDLTAESPERLESDELGLDFNSSEPAADQDFSAMFGEAEDQDFSAMFDEADPDVQPDADFDPALETSAAMDAIELDAPTIELNALTEDAFSEDALSFDPLDVGEDAGILDEEAFDFDLFAADADFTGAEDTNSTVDSITDSTNADLSDVAIAPDTIPPNAITDAPLPDSSLEELDEALLFGSETDLEEIEGAPEVSEFNKAAIGSDLSMAEIFETVIPETVIPEMGMTETVDDFADLDALLGNSVEPVEAIAPDTELGALDALETIESGDFADLDALLNESDVSASAAMPLHDDFADLDALLQDQTDYPSDINAEDSYASAPSASDQLSAQDDFADLDALLSDDFLSTPSVSSLSDASNLDADIIDEFDDLEKLLEDADQTLGGSPSNKSARRPALAPNRRSSRRGGGVLSDQTMRVSVKNLDNLNNLVGELVVNRNSLEQGQERLRQFLDNLLYQVQQLSDVGQRMRDLYERSLLESSLLSNRRSYQLSPPENGGSAVTQSSHSTGLSFDALEMDRFTGFHTLSQEMIELIVRVRESASDIDFVVDETDQVTRMFRQVTTQLQEGLTRSRMVPFAQTADRLPRAVRDISLRCGKQAELTIEGRETLIDKMILEQLYDPMTHLVNNAITHGIETPEERIAARKPPVGRITVRTFHQGNQTVISVTDDGAGIDPQKVKAKAIEKGLVTPAEAREMTELDVYDLLFHHGFSTKDRADDFSGRGIGMDVVRTSLNEIRGVVNIDSTVGKGTTFTVRLPLTLSISKALCCISNRARIAFPMDGVEDMLDVPKERIQTDSEGRSCILWRDTLLPFQPLSDLLKYNRSLGRGSVYGGNQEEDIVSVVVLRSAGNFLALQVDQVLGEQEIVIKQLEGPVPKPVGVAGATVLGDGRIMPIADVLELIDLSVGRIRREAGNALWEKEQEPPVEVPVVITDPTVLIVDDSITVRELLSMTFNKVGYRVEQARDGQEAWEKLRSGLPCDLVFCDIEMPRMDGLELLSRIQRDPNLAHLPIAMLTSRGADRHRQMAVQLGAKGYFTKPYLEEALLDAAQRMLKGEVLVHNG